jgi:hypothetical protein
LFKSGLAKLQHGTNKPEISDATYKYPTYNIKERQFNKESLCTNMYCNRNHAYDLGAQERIAMVIDTLANYDHNGGLLRYLLTLEGPSYCCRRYWDWIEPWVHD